MLLLRNLLIITRFKSLFKQPFWQGERAVFFGIFVLAIGILVIKGHGSSFLRSSTFFGGVVSGYDITSEPSIYRLNDSAHSTKSANDLFDMNGLESAGIQTNNVINQTVTVQDNFLVSSSVVDTGFEGDTEDHAGVATYVVEEGDSLSLIAQDYGVDVQTIMWANNLKNANAIKPGLQLRIPPVKGVIHKVKSGDTISKIAQLYGVDSEKITSFNTISVETKLRVGDELIVPGGIVKSSSTNNGSGTKSVTVKRFTYLPLYDGYFVLPVGEGPISRGGAKKGLHGRNGIDRVVPCGTAVYAAADGKVISAHASGYNRGAGKMLMLSHPNKTETLYAHLSKLFVSNGESVQRGQLIAYSGTTGKSTGCHLHFEVHGAKNPYAIY